MLGTDPPPLALRTGKLTLAFFKLIIAGADLLLLVKATIGADRLNCRVREGIGCTPVARDTSCYKFKISKKL